MPQSPRDEDEFDVPDDSFDLSQVRPFDDEIIDIEGHRLLTRLQSSLFRHEFQPQRVGRWLILERIGAGGMGVVYSAYDPRLDRRVALKVLRTGRKDRADAHARMLREAQALARISDSHVVQIHDVEEVNGSICLVMELIEGTTLRHWQGEPHTLRERVECYVKVAHGLAKIHEAGLVHRDVKPDNVLLADDRVVIADFGLVFVDQEAPVDDGGVMRGAEPTALELSLTADGALVGTLGYMAPEQLAGDGASPLSDQFGFFVSLYEGLTGHRPFRGNAPVEIVEAMTNGALPRVHNGTALPRWLYRILKRGLAFEPEDRFGSMAEVKKALHHGLRRGQRTRTLLALLGGAAVATWFGLRELREQPEHLRDPCIDPQGALVSVWGDAHRARLRDQVSASDDPVEEVAWSTLGQAFNRASQQWASAWQTACYERARLRTVTEDREDESLTVARATCVGEVRSKLEGFSGEVQRKPMPEPESVHRLATELRQLPDCNEPRILAEYQRMLGLAEEPEEAKALRDELNIAHAREILSDYPAALQRADDVASRAQGPGLERVRAEAAYRRGRALDVLGDVSSAQKSLEEAVEITHESHDHVLSAMASVYLAKLLANDPAGGQGGRGWLMLAWNELRMAHENDPPAWLHADFLDAQGIVEQAARDYSSAEEHHRAALETRRLLAGSDDDPDVIRSKNNLANVLSRMGPEHKAEALQLYHQARLSVERLYGADHPLNAKLWINIGIQHLDADRREDAVIAFRAAVRLDRARGAAGAAALRPMVLLGKLAADDEDWTALDAIVAQIEEIHDRLRKDDPSTMTHIDRVNELKLVAQARDDDPRAATAALQEAAAILEPVDAVEHAWTLVDLAHIAEADGRSSDARALLERAVPVLRSQHDPMDSSLLEEAETLLESLAN